MSTFGVKNNVKNPYMLMRVQKQLQDFPVEWIQILIHLISFLIFWIQIIILKAVIFSQNYKLIGWRTHTDNPGLLSQNNCLAFFLDDIIDDYL
jgi:hypothetical protein